MINSQVRVKKFIPATLFTLIVIPILFTNLGAWTVQQWDESRLAISSFEMYQNGFSLIPTFQGGSDIHRTLPPLLVWLQTICMHIFGVSEFALRFPSAVFGVLIGWLFIFWTRRTLDNPWIGFLAGLIAISTRGLNGFHALHSGDYEGALIFFMLLQLILFHSLIQELNGLKRQRIFWFFVVAILLGVLCKGVQALFFTPAFLFYWIINKGWKLETFQSALIKSIAIIAAVTWYYLVREIMEPGYVHWVYQNELGGRYSSAVDLASYYPQFYKEVLMDQLNRWIYLLPMTLFVLSSPKQIKQNGSLIVILCAGIYFLIIDNAATKHEWYLLPIIPLLSFLMAIGASEVSHVISRALPFNTRYVKPIIFGFLVVFCSHSWFNRYIERFSEVSIRPIHRDFYTVTDWLREMNKTNEIYDFVFLDNNYSAHNWWYIEQLVYKGSTIELYSGTDKLTVGKVVLVYQKELIHELDERFEINTIESKGNTRLLLLKDERFLTRDTLK